MPKPVTETWYTWKVHELIEGDEDEGPRLLVPWSDPMVHENSFDFLAKTEEAAQALLDDYEAREEAEADNWVLVKVTLEPIRRADGSI